MKKNYIVNPLTYNVISVNEKFQFQEYKDELSYIVLTGNKDKVKIGKTKKFKSRLSNLRTGDPDYKILLVIPKSRYSESELHNKFKNSHYKQELFYYTDEIQEFVKAETKYQNMYYDFIKSSKQYIKQRQKIFRHFNPIITNKTITPQKVAIHLL